MAEVTDGGLKCFIGVSVKVSSLESWVVARQQLRMKTAALWCAVVLGLPLGFGERGR